MCSRLKRVCIILGQENVENCNIDDLKSNEDFKELTMSVRSQLRKSERLFFEYKDRD